MEVTRKSKPQAGCALFLCAAFAATSCDAPSTPSKPTADVPSGPPVAVLDVERFTLVRDSSGYVAPTVRLVETSGQGGAQVLSVEFNLADSGAPWSQRFPGRWYVAAGGALTIEPAVIHGDYEFTFGVPADYTGRVLVLISFADDQGRKGRVSALASVPQ